jgi:hypothetical protein
VRLCLCSFLWLRVVLLGGSKSVQVFLLLSFVDICIAFGDTNIKRGGDPINWHNPVTLLCLFQSWIANVIFRDLLCVQWFKVRGDCLFIFYVFNDLRSEVIVCLSYCLFIFYVFNDSRSEMIVCLSFICSMIQGQRWLFVYLLYVQWFKVRGDCLFIFYMFNDLRSEMIVCLSFICSMIKGQRWLFVYLLYVQWFKVRGDCLFIFYMFNDLRSEVIVCLSFICSMI